MAKAIDEIAKANAKRMLKDAGFNPRLIPEDVIGLLVAIQIEAHQECIALVNQLVKEKEQFLQNVIDGVRNGN